MYSSAWCGFVQLYTCDHHCVDATVLTNVSLCLFTVVLYVYMLCLFAVMLSAVILLCLVVHGCAVCLFYSRQVSLLLCSGSFVLFAGCVI